MNRLRGHSKEKGFTPEDDQGRPKWWLEAQRYGDRDMDGNRMSEIPEDIRKAVHRVIADLKGRADSIEEDAEAVLADAFSRAILAERQRIADDLFHRSGLMLAKTGDGKHSVEISFRTLEEMHEFHRVLCELSRFKSRGPSLPSSLPEREQA